MKSLRSTALRQTTDRLEQVGLSAALLGAFTVWLPNQAAGLAVIGLELAEWSKFLPDVQAGLVGPRQVLNLPLTAIGLVLVLRSAAWPQRWPALIVRLLALVVALVALPPPFVLLEGLSAGFWPVAMFGFVLLAGILAQIGVLGSVPERVRLLIIFCVALVSAIWPTIVFFGLRGHTSYLLGTPLSVGVGVWLNVLGFALVALGAILARRPA